MQLTVRPNNQWSADEVLVDSIVRALLLNIVEINNILRGKNSFSTVAKPTMRVYCLIGKRTYYLLAWLDTCTVVPILQNSVMSFNLFLHISFCVPTMDTARLMYAKLADIVGEHTMNLLQIGRDAAARSREASNGSTSARPDNGATMWPVLVEAASEFNDKIEQFGEEMWLNEAAQDAARRSLAPFPQFAVNAVPALSSHSFGAQLKRRRDVDEAEEVLSVAKHPKKAYGKENTQVPMKPKTARRAYTYFKLEHMKKVRTENPELDQAAVVQRTRQDWAQMRDKTVSSADGHVILKAHNRQCVLLQVWTVRATEDKLRYLREMEAYKASGNDLYRPKKPRTAYTLWYNDNYETIRSDYAYGCLPAHELRLKISELWRAVPDKSVRLTASMVNFFSTN